MLKSPLLKEHVIKDSMKVGKALGQTQPVQDDSSRSGKDTDADECRYQHPYMTNSNGLRVDYNTETCQVNSPMLDFSSPDNQTTEYSQQSLDSEKIFLKETMPYFKKIFQDEYNCIASRT
ncbi:hypothetical protein Tco_0645836 [Tanacetum coccineum]